MTELKQQAGKVRPNIVHRAFRSVHIRNTRWAHVIFWPVMAIGLTLDLWSKSFVFSRLQQQQHNGISIIDGFLQLVLAENAGAAFGIATGQSQLLVAVSVIALVVIFAVFRLG